MTNPIDVAFLQEFIIAKDMQPMRHQAVDLIRELNADKHTAIAKQLQQFISADYKLTVSIFVGCLLDIISERQTGRIHGDAKTLIVCTRQDINSEIVYACIPLIPYDVHKILSRMMYVHDTPDVYACEYWSSGEEYFDVSSVEDVDVELTESLDDREYGFTRASIKDLFSNTTALRVAARTMVVTRDLVCWKMIPKHSSFEWRTTDVHRAFLESSILNWDEKVVEQLQEEL